MEFDPPIHTRSTNELIHIAHYPAEWNEEAMKQAAAELTKRGISLQEQLDKVDQWNRTAEREWRAELDRRKTEGYDWLELAIMTFKWPQTMLQDWSLRKDGYIKKHKQRLATIAVGFSAVLGIILWVNLFYEYQDIELQNEINNADISEWEQGYYTAEQIIQRRKDDIEKAIDKVLENKKSQVPTYIVVEHDTVPTKNAASLRDLDPANIKDVIFERYLKPEEHEVIKVKLKPAANGS